MIYRKFFDKNGKEVDPKDAVVCKEIITDENGKVIKESWYTAEEK